MTTFFCPIHGFGLHAGEWHTFAYRRKWVKSRPEREAIAEALRQQIHAMRTDSPHDIERVFGSE